MSCDPALSYPTHYNRCTMIPTLIHLLGTLAWKCLTAAKAQPSRSAFRRLTALSLGLIALILTSCTGLMPPNISTPLPAEFLPTAAALTLAARDISVHPATITATEDIPASAEPLPLTESSSAPHPEASQPAAPSPNAYQPPTSTFKPPSALPETAAASLVVSSPTLPPTDTPLAASETPTAQVIDPLLPSPTFTPAPPIPDARIQIYRLGALSKVVTPMDVSLRLTCGDGKVIRIELYSEDGSLLARSLRTYENVPWDAARIGITLDFEILSAAELARIVVSAEDIYGRLIEVNSMDLVLLSQGMTELNPPTGMQQRIIIQDPVEKALIQNKSLIVSGRARPLTDLPLPRDADRRRWSYSRTAARWDYDPHPR